MSSTSPANGQSNNSLLRTYVQQLVPPSASIFFVYYGFVAKSALQTGSSIPKLSMGEYFKGAARAAPLLAAQVVAQNMIEHKFKQLFVHESKQGMDFKMSLISASIVGVATAPALTIFNGWTLFNERTRKCNTWKESLVSLKNNPKLIPVLVGRETAFLFGLKISRPLTEAMKSHFGENDAVLYGSLFGAGVACGLVSHPFDTAFTRWQKSMTVTAPGQLGKGVLWRAPSLGGFFIANHLLSEYLK